MTATTQQQSPAVPKTGFGGKRSWESNKSGGTLDNQPLYGYCCWHRSADLHMGRSQLCRDVL